MNPNLSHEGCLSDLYLVNTLNLLLITAGKQRSVAHEGLLQISAGALRWQMVLQLGPHEGSSDLYRRISQQRPYCMFCSAIRIERHHM